MTTEMRKRVLHVWTSEAFTGTRSDALRMAMAGTAQADDMFADDLLTQYLSSTETEPENPDQLTLF